MFVIKGAYAHFNMYIFTFNWMSLTSEMHFVKFHPEVGFCLLSRGKRKNAPWGWGYYENTY